MGTQPEVFGKYELLRPLATGGMAEVFLASQIGPGGVMREVVVKRVLPSLSSASEFVGMFLDEARLAVRLSHPNVVQVFDFGLQDDSYFLVLELLDGADVDTILQLAKQREQQIPERIAALIAAQACDGLQYVHSLAGPDGRPLHVIHRDVSPSNLFVTYQGTVKLLDFGIAKAESNLSETKAGVTKGKVAYMSPEQLLHEPLDPRSDVFALGVVFYELLAGLGLFHRPDIGAMMRAVLTEPVPRPSTKRPGVSPQLEAVAMRAISRDPAERYTSAAEMRAELDRYLGSLPFVPAGDALQKYLHELVGLDASRKITDRALRMTFTDPAIVPPMPRSVSQQDLAPTTVRPDPTAFPIRDDEAAAPTIIAPDPTAGRPLRIATASFGPKPKPAWQRWLPTALGVPFVLLLAFGLRHWGGDPPARPPDPPAPVVHAAPPPKLAPVPQERPVLPERPIPPERPRPAPEHPRPTRLRVSEDASPKQVARQLAELGGSVGALKLTCEPACLLFVDGEAAGSSPPTKLVYLSAGRHLIKAVDLHSDRERTTGVTVRAGKALVRTVRF